MNKALIITIVIVCLGIAACAYYRSSKAVSESFEQTDKQRKECEAQCEEIKAQYLLGGEDAYNACMNTCKVQFEENTKNKKQELKDIKQIEKEMFGDI